MMKSYTKIEVTISSELAELYEIFAKATESSSPPSHVNRALIETGLVHHVTMLKALELIRGADAERVDRLVDTISGNTIMSDVFKLASDYWEGQTDTGSFTLE